MVMKVVGGDFGRRAFVRIGGWFRKRLVIARRFAVLRMLFIVPIFVRPLLEQALKPGDVINVEIVGQDHAKSAGLTVAGGLVGGAIAGLPGAVVGTMAGSDIGSGQAVALVTLADGRKLYIRGTGREIQSLFELI